MAIPKKIKCERAACKFNDLAGNCTFVNPQLQDKEAFKECLSSQNRDDVNP